VLVVGGTRGHGPTTCHTTFAWRPADGRSNGEPATVRRRPFFNYLGFAKWSQAQQKLQTRAGHAGSGWSALVQWVVAHGKLMSELRPVFFFSRVQYRHTPHKNSGQSLREAGASAWIYSRGRTPFPGGWAAQPFHLLRAGALRPAPAGRQKALWPWMAPRRGAKPRKTPTPLGLAAPRAGVGPCPGNETQAPLQLPAGHARQMADGQETGGWMLGRPRQPIVLGAGWAGFPKK